MTGYALEQDRKKCLAVGMDDFIAKPIESHVLWGMLAKWQIKKPNLIHKHRISFL